MNYIMEYDAMMLDVNEVQIALMGIWSKVDGRLMMVVCEKAT